MHESAGTGDHRGRPGGPAIDTLSRRFMRKVLVFVDGMFMRRRAIEKKTFYYSAKEIRRYCIKHLKPEDYLVRIYYYDSRVWRRFGWERGGHAGRCRNLMGFSGGMPRCPV